MESIGDRRTAEGLHPASVTYVVLYVSGEVLLPITSLPDARREVEPLGNLFEARFGGVLHAVAGRGLVGRWGALQRDDVIVLEVMTHDPDRPWWSLLPAELEKRCASRRSWSGRTGLSGYD